MKRYTDAQLLSAIPQRRSVRSFTAEVMNDADYDALKAIVADIDPDGAHLSLARSGEIGRGASYGVISGRPAYLVMLGDDVLAGAVAAEYFVLAATVAGFGTCWLAGTFKPAMFGNAVMRAGARIPAVIAVGRPAERITMIDRALRLMAGSARRKSADKLFFEGTIASPVAVADSGAAIDPVLEALRLAPSSSNSQAWRVIKASSGKYLLYMLSDNHYTALDAGIAVCHLSLATGRQASYDPAAAAMAAAPPKWHFVAAI
ncbi:MAG: nitroreductase family protein [Muribaculaceae bacterium]